MKRKFESLDYDYENKKLRSDKSMPSNVLDLRGLPEEINESEIASLAIPFGLIDYMVVTRKKAQALIQIENIEYAETMFNYYQLNKLWLRNNRCYFQYSKHNSLAAPNSSMHPDAEIAVEMSNIMHEAMSREDAGCVLRLIIDDYNYENISNLHLFKIFQNYGTLLKIVAYVKKGEYKGFIEYSEIISAKVAKTHTNGMCVFSHGCVMRVAYSNRRTLEINREDEMFRNYVKNPVDPQELLNIHVNNSVIRDRSMPKRKDIRGERDSRDKRACRDLRNSRDLRDSRDFRDGRNLRDSRDYRDIKDLRDSREYGDMRNVRDIRDSRDPRDSRNLRENIDIRDPRDIISSRENWNIRKSYRNASGHVDSLSDFQPTLSQAADHPRTTRPRTTTSHSKFGDKMSTVIVNNLNETNDNNEFHGSKVGQMERPTKPNAKVQNVQCQSQDLNSQKENVAPMNLNIPRQSKSKWNQ